MPLVILSLSPFSHFLSPFSVSPRQTHANSLRINRTSMQIAESYLHMQRSILQTLYMMSGCIGTRDCERVSQISGILFPPREAGSWASLVDKQHEESSQRRQKIRSGRKKKQRGKDRKVPDRLWKSCLRAVSEVNIISGIIYEVKSIRITQWCLPNS